MIRGKITFHMPLFLVFLLVVWLLAIASLFTHFIPADRDSTDRWVALITSFRFGNVLWELASSHGIARERKARWCVMDGDGWLSEYSKYIDWRVDAPERCPGFSFILPFFHYLALFEEVTDAGDGDFAAYSRNYALSPSPRIVANGFLQSFKYFDKTIPIPFRLVSESLAKAWVAERNITAAIHVRRGDKLTEFANIVPSLDYYYRAVATLGYLFPNQTQRFVVSTDDEARVRVNPFFRDMYVVSSANPSFDMAVIAACQHKIISIGTFGWWGAFLNDNGTNHTSAVIYPLPQVEEVWKDRFHNDDYFPPHWTPLYYRDIP